MKKIIFATHNLNKIEEARFILKNNFQILSLNDINIFSEIPENFKTLKDNASQKSWFVFNKTSINCFSDDTGLEVDALFGAPGVYSARYAGINASYSDNVEKLLVEMDKQKNRKARFKTVISLIMDRKEFFFKGVINGSIASLSKGNNGFGYDSIFIPNNYNITFAEMSSKLKNSFSHRAIALKNLSSFLINYK